MLQGLLVSQLIPGSIISSIYSNHSCPQLEAMYNLSCISTFALLVVNNKCSLVNLLIGESIHFIFALWRQHLRRDGENARLHVHIIFVILHAQCQKTQNLIIVNQNL